MLKILLIGGTGKIGKHVLNELQNYPEFEVRLLLRAHANIKLNELSYFQGDITKIETLDEPIMWSDVVVNCAGMVSYKVQDRSLLNEKNINGVKNIINLCGKFDKPLIHTSSVVVYGSTTEPVYHTENSIDANAYLSGYAISKLTADKLILASSVKSIILRPSTLISSTGSTFSKLLSLYRKGFRAGLKGGASFVEPTDISKSYGRAIHYLTKNDFKNEIFNIGGNNILIEDVFDFFIENEPQRTYFLSSEFLKIISFINDGIIFPLFNKSIITRENYLTGSRFTYVDSDKAKHKLGYIIMPFNEAAKRVVNHADHRR